MDSVYAGIPRNEAFVTRALLFFIGLELGFPVAPSNIGHYLVSSFTVVTSPPAEWPGRDNPATLPLVHYISGRYFGNDF